MHLSDYEDKSVHLRGVGKDLKYLQVRSFPQITRERDRLDKPALKSESVGKEMIERGIKSEGSPDQSEKSRKKSENSSINLDGIRNILGEPDNKEKAMVNNEFTGTLDGPICRDRPRPTFICADEN